MVDDLQNRLQHLIGQWRAASDHRQKAKLQQRLLSSMDQSSRIWQSPGTPRDLYEEALQENWLWFIDNLANYDSSRASVMVWFNQRLTWRISDLQRQRYREAQKLWQPVPNIEGQVLTVEDLSSEYSQQSSSSNAFQIRLSYLKRCVGDHQQQLRRCAMRDRPDISCDRILAALFEQVDQAPSSTALSDVFAQVAARWQVDRNAFRRFCSSSCFKLVRQFDADDFAEP